MAERRATNKYYDPNWDPSKGSINKYAGQHPLRDRARKLDQGILIIRFELPYSIWCEGCNKHVGKGVRYNAEKKKVGMYFTTPVWSFRMKCHLCNHWIEIHTDPKNAEYKIVSGARRRVEEFATEDNETMVLNDEDHIAKMQNPLYKLEVELADVKKAEAKKTVITQLQLLSDQHWKDPYTMSQQIRRKFRAEKKGREELRKEAEGIREKHNLLIDILPETSEDRLRAKLITYAVDVVDEKDVNSAIQSEPIFATASAAKAKAGATAVPLREANLRHVISMKRAPDPFSSQSPPVDAHRGVAHEALVRVRPQSVGSAESTTVNMPSLFDYASDCED